MRLLLSRLSAFWYFFISWSVLYAQTYDDVIVLVNSSDSVSVEVGTYFQNQRNIPASRIIAFSMPTEEIITPQKFALIRSQLDSIVLQRNLKDSFAYIVTTKGMPLGISADTDRYYAGVPYSPLNASIESELTLAFSLTMSTAIGDSFAVLNPYYGKTSAFSPNANGGIRLVTRLDGYTLQDVKDLIDRSGPQRATSKSAALVVIDRDPIWDSLLTTYYITYYQDTDTLWDDYYDSAVKWLRADGWTVLYDTTAAYVRNQSNVIAYQSWGSNDHTFAGVGDTPGLPRHTWLPGALAVWYVSTSGRSFQPGTPYGQSLAADLIQEGVSGIAAFVFEPFFWAMPNIALTFSNYLLSTRHRNLAEAFYSSMKPLSWMGTVVGDPKTSISTTVTALTAQKKSSLPAFQLYPNPVREQLYVVSPSPFSGGVVDVLSPAGKLIRRQELPPGAYQLRIFLPDDLSTGVYFVRIRTAEGYAVRRFTKQ